jgi:hypothetical protein
MSRRFTDIINIQESGNRRKRSIGYATETAEQPEPASNMHAKKARLSYGSLHIQDAIMESSNPREEEIVSE